MEDLSDKRLFGFLFHLCPCVFQIDRQIENEFIGTGVRVNAEVAEALKLEALPNCRRRERRLHIASGDGQRVRVDTREESFFALLRVLLGEETVVHADLRFSGVCRRNPMDRGFDLAPIG